MRTIRMKTLQAGPAGTFHPGETRVVGPDEFAVLVPDFADAVDDAPVADNAPDVLVPVAPATVAKKPSGKGNK